MSQLTDFEKGMIIAWRQENISCREIARRLERNMQTVSNVVKKFKDCGITDRKKAAGGQGKHQIMKMRKLLKML